MIEKHTQYQVDHHQTKTFKDEFIQMMVTYGIEYDPRLVFEEEHYG